MLHLEVAARNGPGQDLWTAKEWRVLWASERIRYHWPSFCLLCFYLEVLKNLAPHGTWDEAWGNEASNNHATEEFVGLFTVASNAIYHLEQLNQAWTAAKPCSDELILSSLNWHWALFLGKLLLALGQAPRFNQCCFCQQDLTSQLARWLVAEGGFACANCSGQPLREITDSWHHLWRLWAQGKYADLGPDVRPLPGEGLALSEYFFYQSSLAVAGIKSWPSLLAAGIGPHCRG